MPIRAITRRKEVIQKLESLSIEMMDRLWKHDEMLFVYIQIGAYLLVGRQHEKAR
jgi:hypothetical protein